MKIYANVKRLGWTGRLILSSTRKVKVELFHVQLRLDSNMWHLDLLK